VSDTRRYAVTVCVMCSVRECGAERSLKLLALEDSSSHKLPQVSDIDLRALRDLLVVKSPRSLVTDRPPSVCQASLLPDTVHTIIELHVFPWSVC